MLKTRMAAAELTAEQLFSLEAAMDKAIAEAAAMVAVLPQAAQTGKIAATVGHGAYVEAAAVVQQLIATRGRVVALHENLHEIQHAIGLGARAMGDGWKAVPKPSAGYESTGQAAHLSLVADAA